MSLVQIEDAQRRILSWRARQAVKGDSQISREIATPEASHQ
jgi:hypothetical protein